MTNAEWLMSVPGTDDQKAMMLNCVSCHTLQRIVQSTHDSDEFTQVITRMMNYAQVSQPHQAAAAHGGQSRGRP